MNARKQAEDLGYEIAGEIEQHGECFYEEEELFIVIGKIEKLKRLLFKGYNETEKETEET
jgi:hypothetical protein